MKRMARLQRFLLVPVVLAGLISIGVTGLPSMAENSRPPHHGDVSGRSVFAGVVSLIVWPGLGQAINENPSRKVATHALLGLLPPYRLWSAYDAVMDRRGGYWNGKI